MQINFIDIEIPDQTMETFDRAIHVLWILYLPPLVKFIIQMSAACGATLWYGLKGLARRYFRFPSQKSSNEKLPKVAVIIPAYNEEVGILKTIRSVINTEYRNMQIVVVNDGSTDSTHEKVIDFIKNYTDLEKQDQTPIQYIRLPNGGKAKAMNIAIQSLESDDVDIVMTFDADSAVHRKAIHEMVTKLQNHPQAAAVAGNVVVANRTTFLGRIQQMEYLSGFFAKRGDSVFGAVYIIGGAAAAYRKSVLDEVGTFDDSVITEDIELSMRILRCNHKTVYAHNAVVYTEGPSDWKGLANQRLRWKYGRLTAFFKHRSLFFNIHHWNVYLCWFLLPLTFYGEAVLLLQPFVLVFSLFYMLVFNMFTFLIVMAALAGLSLIQIAVDRHRSFHCNLLLLVPFFWVVAVSIDFVEWTALLRSVRRLLTGQGLQWQKWKRVGIATEEDLETDDSEVGSADSDHAAKEDLPHELTLTVNEGHDDNDDADDDVETASASSR